jgi:heme/copper-type cytochrome/quinol oxidase subunit 2
MFKKIITLFFLLFCVSKNMVAQCAMCKAVIEGGNENMAEGVNNGITYLMIFPYLLIGILFYFIYRHRKKAKE